MKKILTLLLILGGSLMSFAQDCKYEVEELDKFTKEETKVTKHEVLWNHLVTGDNLSIKAKSVNGEKSLLFRNSERDAFNIKVDSKAIFLFSDDETLTLDAEKDAESIYQKADKRWVCNFSYKLSEEQAALLSKKTVTDIRIYTAEGHLEKAIKDERQGNIKSIMRCISK